MNKTIAIPVENGELCPHFGHCPNFVIFTINNSQIIKEELITPPPHEPGVLPAWLSQQGVTDVIAGGIGQKAISLFNQNEINVFAGAKIKTPKALAEDLINNNLEAGSNYCDH
ncbi:MAG: ATPase [Bacteroidales bacterium]|nr:ATPase [Bacteroidales bacterium]